ncbi:hypothetical protein ACE6H2_010101 [Prunus campanulata]
MRNFNQLFHQDSFPILETTISFCLIETIIDEDICGQWTTCLETTSTKSLVSTMVSSRSEPQDSQPQGQCSSDGIPELDGLSASWLMDLLHGSEFVLTYEDKDDDWMLVGDVPWKMFTETCRRLRIMKGSEAIGLAPRAVEKCKNRN